jgi:hypothetical protein
MNQMRKDFLVTVEWDEEGSSSPTPSDIEAALQNALRGLVTKLAAMGASTISHHSPRRAY